MTGPKVVLYDIETVQNLVATFRLWEPGGLHLPHENLMSERYIVCAAWKELNRPTIHTSSVLDDRKRYRKDPTDDRHVVEALHRVMSEADVLIGHNSDQYDRKFVDTRILYYGLPPLAPAVSIDTFTVAKSRFLFNSNRLDYLGRFLGLGKKIRTDVELWMRIIRGDERAIHEMLRYNKQDVVLLEKVFKKLQPYIPNHVNRQLYGSPEHTCTRCGSAHVEFRGTRKTLTREYRRFQCQACGGWDKESKSVGSARRRPI